MEVCDIVGKSVNLLLSRTVTGCLSRLVHGEGLTIPQLGQVWVNISHLADSIPQLEEFIRHITRTGSEGASTVRLYGGSTFKDAKVAVEQQIIVRLTGKCAEIMEGAQYDWTTKQAQDKPSDYLNDCLHYLETTFHALQILPEELVSNLCQQALKNLAMQMEGVLLSDSNPRVSTEAIRSFSVDLTCCQRFVMSTVSTYSYLRGTDASLAFEPLKQLVDLFLGERWSDYISEYPSLAERHKHVAPYMVHGLLSRLKESEIKKKRKFHSQSAAKKDRQKYYELILKKLEEFIAL
jgi:hypothetical protein